MCAIFSKLQDPFWAGFVGDGRGFFCLEVPAEELQQSASNAVLVCLNSGNLSAEQVEAEFKDFVEDDWEWQVRKLQIPTSHLSFLRRKACAWPSVGEA
jgi:hypothetical protein